MSVHFVRHTSDLGISVWKIRWRPEGYKGPNRGKHFVGTREEAEAYDQSLHESLGLGQAKKPTAALLPLESALPEYMQWHKLHRAATTHEDTKRAMPRLMSVFGRLTTVAISPRHITEFVLLRPDKRRANQKDIHYLQGFVSWMAKMGYGPALSFKPELPKYRRPVPRVPSTGDVEAVLAEISDPIKRGIVLLMWQTGARISSVLQARWERVSWDRGTMEVPVKGGRSLLLPIPDDVREILYPRRKPSGWVFVNPKTGEPFKDIKTQLRNAARRAGVPMISHHKFRHSFATDTLEATGDLRLVQSALGHLDIHTTTIYTQVQTRRLQDAQQRVAELRKESRQGTPVPRSTLEKEHK